MTQSKPAVREEARALRAEIRRVIRATGWLRLRKVESPRHVLVVIGLCGLGAVAIVPDLLLLLIVLGLVGGLAVGVGEFIARALQASQRGRLRGRLAGLPEAERESVLAPLQREYRKDLREFAEELGRDLPPVRSAEVTPASAPLDPAKYNKLVSPPRGHGCQPGDEPAGE